MENLQEEYFVARVQFNRFYGPSSSDHRVNSDAIYSYKTNLVLKKNDFAVVVVDNIPKVVKVVEVISNPLNADYAKATKWIVSKIDFTEYEQRIKAEELQKRIIKKLDDRLKAMQRIKVYEQMSESDPEMKGLLEELGKINPGLLPEKTKEI